MASKELLDTFLSVCTSCNHNVQHIADSDFVELDFIPALTVILIGLRRLIT